MAVILEKYLEKDYIESIQVFPGHRIFEGEKDVLEDDKFVLDPSNYFRVAELLAHPHPNDFKAELLNYLQIRSASNCSHS
jgi:hypothetical protein